VTAEACAALRGCTRCGMKGAASARPHWRRLRDAQTTLRSISMPVRRAEALPRAAPPAALRGGSGVSGLRAQSMYQKIEEKLKAGLKPVKLTIVDNSHQHAGHAGVNGRESVPAPALAASALPASHTISPFSTRSLSDDPMRACVVSVRAYVRAYGLRACMCASASFCVFHCVCVCVRACACVCGGDGAGAGGVCTHARTCSFPLQRRDALCSRRCQRGKANIFASSRMAAHVRSPAAMCCPFAPSRTAAVRVCSV